MFTVTIFGAGSIGNHLAHACRIKGWDVAICDTDPAALERTKNDIYPSRYGRWDEHIRLCAPEALRNISADLVIIGTPPDSHIPLALDVLEQTPPKVLLLEKPLCPPSLEGGARLLELTRQAGVTALVGYNHVYTPQTIRAAKLLATGFVGKPLTMSAKTREHWGGIFSAHPWLKGPQDSYLGFWERGGGASCEHSHALNIWQHFAHLLGAGRIVEVTAMMDMVEHGGVCYDQVCQISVRTQTGLVGLVVQDVVTSPTEKSLRIQGDCGSLEWYVNIDPNHDGLRYRGADGQTQEELFVKTRPDDFKGEIDHIEDILTGKRLDSCDELEKGLETMLVLAAAHRSHATRKTVSIDYRAGFVLDALVG